MYLRFYGLREEPFGSTPDPRFLFASASHREAMASLQYSIESGRGFFALIAPPGMGKTTLLFQALEKYHDSACTAFLFNTQCSSREFIRFLLSEVGIDEETDDIVRLHRRFNEFLIANARLGRRFILIVDEAQNLSSEVLETVRLLSDFETSRAKLMQIVLAGQPELYATLKRPDMSQLLQRISIVSGLESLNAEETKDFINHRLNLAGYSGQPIFSDGAIAMVARYSRGIPRLINSICFNALSLGYASESKHIDVDLMKEVVADLPHVLGASAPGPVRPRSNQGARPRRYIASEPRRVVPPVASATPPVASVPRPMPTAPSLGKPSPVAPRPADPRPADPRLAVPRLAVPRPAPKFEPTTNPVQRPPVARGTAMQTPINAPKRSREGVRTSPATPNPLPLLTAAYARPRRRGDLLDTVLLLLMICGAVAGYFAVGHRIGKQTSLAPQSVNAAPPAPVAAEEGASNTAVPARTLTSNNDAGPREESSRAEEGSASGSPAQVQEGDDGSKGEAAPAETTDENSGSAALTGRKQPAKKSATHLVASVVTSAEGSVSERAKNADVVIVQPQLIERVHPNFPSAAIRTNAEGEVVLTANVNARGTPENVKFVEGNEVFRRAALDAVSQWKYRPGTYNGRAAGMPVTIRLKFAPSE